MCTNVHAYFKCRAKHERDEGVGAGLRLKYIATCRLFRATRVICTPANRQSEHVVDEDDDDDNCPACKGETPPESRHVSTMCLGCREMTDVQG
jgi:hypothetical protein